MGQNSEISWTHHTFNPWWGCVKVSAGCANCYAETFSNRYGMKVWGQDAERRFFGDKHWREPLKWNVSAIKAGERHRVFCASMSDVFERRDDVIPHRTRLFNLILNTPQLDWLLLTKRPENYAEMWTETEWPKRLRNVWLGVTAEDHPNYVKRWPLLAKAPATVRFISYEPAMGPLIPTEAYVAGEPVYPDWLICGGESGPKARALHPEWAQRARDGCVRLGIAYHFKQWGEWAPLSTVSGHQELPFGNYIIPSAGNPGFGFIRKGKTAAGRILDGRTWDEFPTVLTEVPS
jgi:protein gp37